jgi:tripartite-type tricarboxylate transporter receptor subunit TctC
MIAAPNTKEGAVTTLIHGLALIAAMLWADAISAQGLPNRPVKLVVPFAPAGPISKWGKVIRGAKIKAEWIPALVEL